jgi:glycosyltransferase involved in cell wall biosynthesis
VNLQSPLNSLGYGTVGLNVALALEKRGDNSALWPIGPVEVPEEHHAALHRLISNRGAFDHKAASLKIWHQFDLAQHIGSGPRCAYPFFELDRLKPVEKHHLASQDIIFCPSQWAADVIAHAIPHDCPKLAIARPGVDRKIFEETEKENHIGTTTFLCLGKFEVRKSHAELIEAFSKAFGPNHDVKLVMNCHNPCFPTQEACEKYNKEWSQYCKDVLGNRVEVIEKRLSSQKDVAKLIAHSDCVVLPSKAEGWNCEAVEAMSQGKQVILTNYSAHTEYATHENSRLIEIDEVEPAHDGVWFRADDASWGDDAGCWAKWGQSQEDQLVEHLRAIHKEKQEGRLLRNEAGIATAKHLTWDATLYAMEQAIGN